MSSYRAILAVLLVVAAGCSALPTPDGRSSTLTPVAVPTDHPTEAPPETIVPGVMDRGLVDPDAVVAAHADILRNRSFTYRATYTERAPDGTLRSRTNTTVRFEATDRYHYRRIDRGPDGPVRRDERWSDGEMVWERRGPAGGPLEETVRPAGPGGPPVDRTGRRGLEAVLRAVETTVNARVVRNETTYVQLTGVGLATPNPSALDDASLTVIVDGRGLVHQYRLEYAVDRGDPAGPASVVAVVRFTAVGATAADPPDWVDGVETTGSRRAPPA